MKIALFILPLATLWSNHPRLPETYLRVNADSSWTMTIAVPTSNRPYLAYMVNPGTDLDSAWYVGHTFPGVAVGPVLRFSGPKVESVNYAFFDTTLGMRPVQCLMRWQYQKGSFHVAERDDLPITERIVVHTNVNVLGNFMGGSDMWIYLEPDSARRALAGP